MYQYFGQGCYGTHEKAIFQIPKHDTQCTPNFRIDGYCSKRGSHKISRNVFHLNTRYSNVNKPSTYIGKYVHGNARRRTIHYMYT